MRRSFSEQITQRVRREKVFTKIKFTCPSYSFLANSKHHTRAAVRESNPRLSALSLKDSYAKRYAMENTIDLTAGVNGFYWVSICCLDVTLPPVCDHEKY